MKAKLLRSKANLSMIEWDRIELLIIGWDELARGNPVTFDCLDDCSGFMNFVRTMQEFYIF